MSDDDFGEGSKGVPWAPAPGFGYVGDSWCYSCSRYIPAERPLDGSGPPRISQHGPGCPGSLQPAQVKGAGESF